MAAWPLIGRYFLTSLEPLSGIRGNLAGSKYISPLPSLFFGPIRKSRSLPWSMFCRDIFYVSSVWNLNESRQEVNINIFYHLPSFCAFRADPKTKMPTLASDLWRHLQLLYCTTEQNSTKLDRKQEVVLNVVYQIRVFRADRKTKIAALASEQPRHFRLLFCTEFIQNLTGSNISTSFINY